MSDENARLRDWIGRSETAEDLIATAPARRAAAMFDDPGIGCDDNDPLPPLWHWFYFLAATPQSALGSDGHPQRGAFLPPVPLPRRMFAGGRLAFRAPLRIGRPALRHSQIADVNLKEGRTGPLCFVTVRQTISQVGEVCIEEEQQIVYRGAATASLPAPQPVELPPLPDGAWSRTITPDPPLLFRFSALTFNAHRIHYDRSYAMAAEGYPGLVVHGPLTAMLLIDLVRRHTTRPVSAYRFRAEAPLFELAPFRLVAMPDARVSLQAQAPDGRIAMAAEAELG
jgi:3-methylfumaryl-CoA hydratase